MRYKTASRLPGKDSSGAEYGWDVCQAGTFHSEQEAQDMIAYLASKGHGWKQFKVIPEGV